MSSIRTDRRGFALRMWLAGFALALLLTPGFNLFETPAVESLEHYVKFGRISFETPPLPAVSPHRVGVDGRYYPTHELGTLLVGVPFAWVAEGAARWTGFPFKRTFELLMAGCSALLFGVSLVALFWELPGQPGAPGKARVLLALLLSSQYVVYLGFPADVSMSATVMALLCLAWRRAAAGSLAAHGWAGVAGGALVLLKLTNSFVPLTAGVLVLSERDVAWRARLARLLVFALGAVPGIGLAAWWNHVRTGSPMTTQYRAVHDFEPELLPEGLLASLVSPGKGLLVYTPTLLLLPLAIRSLPSDRVFRREAALVIGSAVLTLLRLAATRDWDGHAGWGVRYYVPWIPSLMLLLAKGAWWSDAGHRKLAIAGSLAIGAGLVINLAGLLTNFHYRTSLCGYDAWTLTGVNVCAVAALPANLGRSLGLGLPEELVPGASASYVFVSNRLTLWWYALRTLGVPRLASWGLGLFLLLVSLRSWRSAMRRITAGSRHESSPVMQR